MTINNPLPYECQPDTTPDIWGVYPENALLRQQIEKNEELLDTLMKTIETQAHEMRNLYNRIDYNAGITKNQFHAINTFFKWVMEHYEIDKQDDIWEMLDGMFQEGLLVDPRSRKYRMQVTRIERDNYDIEFPWDTTEERAQEILREATLAGQFTRTDFQDITQLGGVSISVVSHSPAETEWSVWNRGQVSANDSSNPSEAPW